MSESTNNNEMSKSKQKRIAESKAREAQRHKKVMTAMWSVLIPVLIVGFIVALVVINKANQLNYSKYLNDDGTIANIDIDKYATVDYENMSFSRAELEPSESVIESEITQAIEDHTTLSTDTGRIADEDDTVGISYTSRIDGEVQETVGEDSEYKYEIGSEEIDAAFDKALIGHKAGDSFTVDVTYDEDADDEKLAGKTVSYEVNFKGVYEAPIFDDAFVAANYPERGSTVAEFRESVRSERFRSSLKSKISSTISMNTVYTAYPKKFMDYQTKVLAAQDEENLDYYNQMYMQYTGQSMYGTVFDMYGVSSQDEYDALLIERAQNKTQKLLSLQYVFKHAGLSITKEELQEKAGYTGNDEAFKEAVSTYGYGYIAQSVLDDKVCEYLCDVVKITD
ncbi:MAG: FKBP-type peptidyl-prolyl cis-trans isomerase [Lachnospiraceae bacterium]|nr:FKBP-type peptidyl-prolyl cis-trans isomerase [Lachnospiraceae bacterium]